MSFFSKIFNSKSILNTNSSSSVVGIDIGSSAIKVIEIKKKGSKAYLETYGIIKLGMYADTDDDRAVNLSTEKTIEALKEVLKQAGVTSNSVAFSVPMPSSLIFKVDLPANLTEKEISQAVPIEAKKYIPVPINEISLDYFTLAGKEPSFEDIHGENPNIPQVPKKEILVVAVQNEAISRLRSISSNTNLEASFFEVEIFSSVRANFEHELSLVLLMDFGASRTKLSLVEFGMVKSYHTINRGGADMTEGIKRELGISFKEAETLKKEYGLLGGENNKNISNILISDLEYIFAETNNVLIAYEKKYGVTITKVILTGGGSLMKGLVEMAQNNFKAEIQIGEPFSKITAPKFLEHILEKTGPEFAVAIGLALRKLQ